MEDLAKFERGDGTDDYRHRMKVNIAAFLVVLALIGAGLWLADTMAQMRKNPGLRAVGAARLHAGGREQGPLVKPARR